MDVTPRTGPHPAGADGAPAVRPPRSRGRAVIGGLVVATILGAIGFVLIRQIDGATVYYYNADEAVDRRSDLGDRRFRVQGTVVGDLAEVGEDQVRFAVVFNGAKVTVLHTGAEPALFRPGVPAVAEGRWADDGSVFLSDRIVIKHTEEYKEGNPDRVPQEAP